MSEIVAAPSTSLDRDRLAGRFRFIHIDGGHACEVVREDILTARGLLGKGGVVVFDDWSQPRCPGVALALWQEYLRCELILLCLAGTKLYATWDSGGLTPKDLDDWAGAQPSIEVSSAYRLAGREVRRDVQKKADIPVDGPSPSTISSPGPPVWLRLIQRVRNGLPPTVRKPLGQFLGWTGRFLVAP